MDKVIEDELVLEIALKEYELAQTEAQHADNVAWLMTSIFLIATFTIFVHVLQANDNLSISVGTLIGCILIIFNMIIFQNAQNVKRQKQDICNEIERGINHYLKGRKYKMNSHLSMLNWISLRCFYHIVMIIIIITFMSLSIFKIFLL